MPTIITRGAASAKAFGFTGGGASTPVSSQTYGAPGTYTWVAPTGVTSVSVVVVGGGSLSAAGATEYKNNISVTAGSSYTVKVGASGGLCLTSNKSYFNTSCTVYASYGSCRGGGCGGGKGGTGGANSTYGRGGGGAGGYSSGAGCASGGNGGGGGGPGQTPCYSLSAAGGGGSGGNYCVTCGYSFYGGGGGGGQSLFGAAGGGTGGVACGGGGARAGIASFDGTSGVQSNGGAGGDGGTFGGQGGAAGAFGSANGQSASGGVRIVWPGSTRSFPLTCVSATGEYGSAIFAGTPGAYTWIPPIGVTKISAVAIGGGSNASSTPCCYFSGGGGSLSYLNNYSVTPGNSYRIQIGSNGFGSATGSYFNNTTTLYAQGGGYTGIANAGTASYVGGSRQGSPSGGDLGGGGAGGYSGAGGAGATYRTSGSAGTGGAGGGGGSAPCGAGGGGGTGLFGQGTSGSGGSGGSTAGTYGGGGGGGSGGCAGANAILTQRGGNGGKYGGGGGIGGGSSYGVGIQGAVRIVWPGCKRSFPSTCVGVP